MEPDRRDPAVMKKGDAVGQRDCGGTVDDDEGGDTLQHIGKRVFDERLGVYVKGR